MTEIAKAYVQIIPSMQGFGNSVRSALSNEGDAAGKSFSERFGSAAKGALGAVGKGLAAGIAAAGAAAVSLAKSSLEAYGEYEQLIGGVETLFKESAGQVQEYAANAYNTAGLSANEYMETVTGFSASLLQSLGGDTEEAARVANRAIVDMADNANKMGTSMESIQNAYQGFSKQNYTMLDNLKLGYGGTKSEMERLIADAAQMTDVQQKLGITVDESSMSFGNIVNAISVMQESLGIAGTTSREASTTIQGSVNAMKSAWSNLIVGIADDQADFDTLVNNFVDSAVTAGENIIPRVETIIGGLGKLISAASDRLVPLVVSTIVDNLPSIVESGVQLVVTLAGALIKALPQIIAAAPQIIMALVNGIKAQWPQIQQAGREAIDQLGNTLKSLASSAASWGHDLMDNFIGGIRAKFDALRSAVSSAAQTVRNFLGFSEPSEGPLSNFHTFSPDMMKLYAQGILQNTDLVENALRRVTALAAGELSGGFDIGQISPASGVQAVNTAFSDAESILHTDVSVSFGGSLSALAMVLQPYFEAETTRIGKIYAPA